MVGHYPPPLYEKELVFSGVECSLKEQRCRVWWLSTIKDTIYQVEVRIPMKFRDSGQERSKEIEIGDVLQDSVAVI